jgi:N6-adenosine-specific RNA methylase IME4
MESQAETLRRAKGIRSERARASHKRRLADIAASCRQMGFAWPKGRFAVLYLDPPWDHEIWSDAGKEKSPEAHYQVMSIEDLMALDIASIANDDAVMFMFAARPHLFEALKLMEHHGFSYVSHLVWLKNTMGLGRWGRDRHELLLIGVKGNVPPPPLGEAVDSVIKADTNGHSVKPAAFREIIDQYFPGLPKIELFARGKAPEGWVFWGNQVEE